MAATAYSNEFKDRAVQAFLTKGARSTREISREFGVTHSTLYVWVSSSNYEVESTEAAASPDRWQPSRRMQAIAVYDSLAEEERGEFLRSNGLSSVHIDKWRQMLYPALEVRDQEKVRLEKRIRELERDLERKDKALAEAAVLLILQKKARHLLFLEQ
ncbi:MAG: transposase [Oligoflexus sp.]|nr:transposase [Oligoflexus sp.]